MSIITFEKYSASGNDFLITQDNPLFEAISPSKLAKLLCNRFEGIGSDGLVILSSHTHYPYKWDFYNSDGSSALMCGNASRCVGLYAFLHSLASQKHCFLSGAGEIKIEVLNTKYPYRAKSNLGKYQLLGNFGEWLWVDTGVPHLVSLAKSKEEFDALSIEEMQRLRHEHNANINIAYQDKDHYKIKTYERGVEGITLACGTGMASLVALLEQKQMMQKKVCIMPPIGERLKFELQNGEILFEGEVKKIATCQINLRDFGVKNER